MERLIIEILSGVALLLIGGFFKHINNQLKKIYQKLELVIIEQQSTDFALEKSFGNGYSKYKSMKREELIEKNEFINRK